MKKGVGFLILIIVIGVVAFVATRGKSGGGAAPGSGAAIMLKGYVGGEKMAFIQDPDIVKILKKKYNISVDASKRGSIEMVDETPPADIDFLWPSSQVALQFYQEKGGPLKQSEVIFNSPMVLYTWAPVAQALIKQGIVQQQGNVFYVNNFPKLIELIRKGTPWKDLGLPELFNKINIFSTDPNQSNSGTMFAGMLATELSGEQVATEASLPKVMPDIKGFFDRQGFMETSSETIFKQFLQKGMGDKPIIVGYEAQLLGYRNEDPNGFDRAARSVVTLYPKPTAWSSHPLIALNDNARRLIAALQDPDIQKLAWERHGFRSTASQGSSSFAKLGIPANIDAVMNMPSAKTMRKILRALAQ